MKDVMWIKICNNCFWNKSIQTLIIDSKNKRISTKLSTLLELLIKGDGKPVDVHSLYWEIWEDSYEFNSKLLRNLVSELRKLIPCIKIINYYGKGYALQKFKEQSNSLEDHFKDIFDQATHGIIISDAITLDNPIMYANQAFCDIFDYTYSDVVGKNFLSLQSNIKEQKSLILIEDALLNQKSVTVMLQNSKKNGEIFLNQVSISPIFDHTTRKIKYFLWLHQDISKEQTFLKQLKQLL